jgi:MoaA/NifB/PqqE/SkfB family radical SAM enzyme
MTSLNSNAWLAEAHMDELAASLDMLVVSLDGPEREHDLVRRQPGSYARVLRVLEGARRRGLATATITVLSAQNLHVVDDVLALAEQHAFYAYFQPAYEDCFQHARGLDPALGPAVLADLAARLRRAHEAGQPVGASAGFLERLGRGPAFGSCRTCRAGRYFGTVMPDGKVVPCHLTSGDHAYPDGRRMGFAAAFRALPRPKPGPGCAISPYQETDLIFSGDTRAIAAALARLAGAARSKR